MSHIDDFMRPRSTGLDRISIQPNTCEPLVLVVEDGAALFPRLGGICEFLNVAVERIGARADLLTVLERRRPMAVVTELDGREQDGCFVLMTVAAHDRDLPVLMVTGRDTALAGAVDAVAEVWGLSAVTQAARLPDVGGLVEFLFRAGRRAGMNRLMPI
jgi:ActR/RegA family two-component response regulator